MELVRMQVIARERERGSKARVRARQKDENREDRKGLVYAPLLR